MFCWVITSNETDWSQPTPCNSHESSPVPEGHCHHDDSVVELEASQDELDERNMDESTDFSIETLQDSQVLKCQLHERHKQVKKAKKQARIQQLHSQFAETDHQLDMLKQKTICLRQEFQPASSNKYTPESWSPGPVVAPASRFGCGRYLSEPVG